MRAKTAQHFNKEDITMTREELERRLNEAEKQNLGLLDEIKRLKEKLLSRISKKSRISRSSTAGMFIMK
jgi:hypothetical protein